MVSVEKDRRFDSVEKDRRFDFSWNTPIPTDRLFFFEKDGVENIRKPNI